MNFRQIREFFEREQVSAVENYFFKLLKSDGAILAIHSAAHSELSAVWSDVANLARGLDMIGGRIVVTNQSGEVVILVGAATARSYPLASKDAKDATVPHVSAPATPASSEEVRLLAHELQRCTA